MNSPIFEHENRPRGEKKRDTACLRWIADSTLYELHGAIQFATPYRAYRLARMLFGQLKEIERREMEGGHE